MVENVIELAQRAIAEGGYMMLGLLILVENLFPPIPSEAILPLAGYGVFTGTLDFVPAILAATAGSLIGALILYALGRWGGRPVLLRYGRLLRLDQRSLDRADAWFDHHGPKIVFFGRLLPGLRSVVSVPAGMSEMPLRTFVVLTTAGSLIWNTALIGGGWALGERWRRVAVLIDPVDTYLLAAAAVALAAWFILHRRSRRAAEGKAVS